MKHLFILSTLVLLMPAIAQAETEEEEMARYQKQLNQQVFGLGKKKEVKPAAQPQPAAEPPPVASAPEPEPIITHYKLAGVSLGMEESEVVSALKASGYACNMAEMAQLSQVVGRKVCIYVSTESPKMAMISFTNGKLRDLELREEYKSGFPEEIYKQIKDKFIAEYSGKAKCRSQRRGETCEVFGQGYRIMLRSEIRESKATITRSVKTM